MELVEELKGKKSVTRGDIAQLLASIGKPGENRDDKIAAVQELHKSNFQGHSLESTLKGYQEY